MGRVTSSFVNVGGHAYFQGCRESSVDGANKKAASSLTGPADSARPKSSSASSRSWPSNARVSKWCSDLGPKRKEVGGLLAPVGRPWGGLCSLRAWHRRPGCDESGAGVGSDARAAGELEGPWLAPGDGKLRGTRALLHRFCDPRGGHALELTAPASRSG